MKLLPFFMIVLLTISCKSDKNNPTVQKINAHGIVGEFISQKENMDNPIVLLIPGSGGPMIQKEKLYGLVEAGYDVLSLAYFGKKGLPKKIEQIRMEYFNDAVTWLGKVQIHQSRKIVMLGISRGAEAALFYASLYQNIDGLILYSPGCLSLPTHVGLKKDEKPKASWTFEGKDIPTIQLDPFRVPPGDVTYKDFIAPFIGSEEVMKPAMPDMDQIRCPVLMLSGGQDEVWPSPSMAQVIENLLYDLHPEQDIFNITYGHAGHQFLWFGNGEPNQVTSSQSMRITGMKKHRFKFGGTEVDTKKAMIQSKIETLRFLENIKSR